PLTSVTSGNATRPRLASSRMVPRQISAAPARSGPSASAIGSLPCPPGSGRGLWYQDRVRDRFMTKPWSFLPTLSKLLTQRGDLGVAAAASPDRRQLVHLVLHSQIVSPGFPTPATPVGSIAWRREK